MNFKEQIKKVNTTRPKMHKISNNKNNQLTVLETPFSATYPDIVITLAGKPCSQKVFQEALTVTEPQSFNCHAHDCFFLVYVNKGQNLEIVENQKMLITENDLLLLTPQTLHQNLHTKDSEIAFFHINTSIAYKYLLPIVSKDILLSHFFSDYLTDQSVKKAIFFPDCMDTLRPILLKIIKEYTEVPPMYNAMLCSLLTTAIVELARMKAKVYDEFQPILKNQMRDILAFMTENYRDITLSDIALQFGYHPTYLSALIKKETGSSFRNFIADYKLTQACLLLQERKMNIEQIAHACGYQDSSNFYKAFMKQYHCSPGEWRKNH